MALLRNIFYLMPPGLRFITRFLVYYPVDIWDAITGKRNKDIPPKRLIYTGGGDFVEIGRKMIDHVKACGIITPSSKVLDVGSGIGRLAIPLTPYLTEGQYEGFDIIKTGVRWCQHHISTTYPNFRFRYISLSNDLYREDGGDAGKFIFPYEDGSFDLVIVISVFTHLLPAEVENYIKEIRRVLKKDGHCYSTFFLLNDNSEGAMKESDEFNFKHQHGYYSLLNENVKSANVSFQEKYLDSVFEKNNFIPILKEYGSWSGAFRKDSFNFQDIVITRKN